MASTSDLRSPRQDLLFNVFGRVLGINSDGKRQLHAKENIYPSAAAMLRQIETFPVVVTAVRVRQIFLQRQQRDFNENIDACA